MRFRFGFGASFAMAMTTVLGLFLIDTAWANRFQENLTGIDFVSSLFLLVVVSAYCLIVLLWSRLGLFEVVTGYFFLFPVAVVGIYQTMTRRFPWNVAHSPDDMLAANMLCATVVLFMLVGNVLGAGRHFKLVSTVRLNQQILLAKWALFFTALLITASNGWTRVLSPRFSRNDNVSGLTEQITFIAAGMALTSFLVLVVARNSTGFKDRVSRLTFWCAGAYVFLLFNPIGNPRFVFVGYVLAMICAIMAGWSFSAKSKGWTFFALTLGNFFVFPAMKSLGAGLLGGWDLFVKSISNFSENLYYVDLDVPQMIANGFSYYESFGGTPLNNILGFIFFFVPRSIWPDKPIGTSYQTMDALNYSFLNLSYPYFLDLYSSGGIILLGFVVTLISYVVVRLGATSRLAADEGSFALSMVFYALCTGFAPIILRGPVNNVIALFGFAFYTVLLIRVASKFRLRDAMKIPRRSTSGRDSKPVND